jgi:hypothetical protein
MVISMIRTAIIVIAVIIMIPAAIVITIIAIRMERYMIGATATITEIRGIAVPPRSVVIAVPVIGVIRLVTSQLPIPEKCPVPVTVFTLFYDDRVLFKGGYGHGIGSRISRDHLRFARVPLFHGGKLGITTMQSRHATD